jgi:hypothetical protein
VISAVAFCVETAYIYEYMDNKQLAEISRDQLSRVLSFFSRVDTVSSIVLGIDIGMLAVLGASAPAPKLFTRYTLFALLPVILIALSLWHLYKGTFPRLEGGWRSLIYFREIAQRDEEEFIKGWINQTDDEYVRDLLSQIWRNSEILTQKFDHLRAAFRWLAFALLPWIVALFLFASKNTETFIVK